MSRFITRVELISADADDYENLHVAMAKENFTRTITSDKGVVYHLPPAEYNREGNYTRDQTLEAAIRACTATDRKFRILVTEAIASKWHNLEPVIKK